MSNLVTLSKKENLLVKIKTYQCTSLKQQRAHKIGKNDVYFLSSQIPCLWKAHYRAHQSRWNFRKIQRICKQ